MKNKNLILGSIALIGVGAVFVLKYIKNKPKSNDAVSDSQSGLSNPSETAPRPNNQATGVKQLNPTSFPLKKSSNGFEVQVVQKWLNDNGYASPKLTEDGILGSKTELAIIAMQNHPYTKSISDYISSMTKQFKVIPKGVIDKDFYDFFITKTRKPSTNALDIGIQF